MPYISKEQIEQAIAAIIDIEQPVDDAVDMLQGLLTQQEGEPVAYMNPDDLCVDTAFRWVKLDEFTEPVFTRSAPLTQITADMAQQFENAMPEGHGWWADRDVSTIIETAVQVYMGAKKPPAIKGEQAA